MSDVVIILNPWAGRGRAGKQRAMIEQELKGAGLEYRMMPVSYTHLDVYKRQVNRPRAPLAEESRDTASVQRLTE